MKFTEKQKQYLKSLKRGDIIKDKRILNKVATLHEHTGEIVRGLYGGFVKAWYVDDCDTFQVDSESFGKRYFSGCFMPFVVKL